MPRSVNEFQVSQGQSVLGEGHNRNCRRKSYGYNYKGFVKVVSYKGRLWVGRNTVFANDLVGFPSRKKSKAIYHGMKTRECQGVLVNVRFPSHGKMQY